jgi:hypothetical protein
MYSCVGIMDSFPLNSDKESFDSIKEQYENTEIKSRYVHNHLYKETVISNNYHSFGTLDLPNHAADMTFEVQHNPAEPLEDEALEDPDAEEELLAREKAKLEALLERCLFCPHGSKSFGECLAHMKKRHNFIIPDPTHLLINPINLIRYFRHIRPKNHSVFNLKTDLLSFDHFAGLPSTAFTFVNQRSSQPRTSFRRGASEARRIYRRLMREDKTRSTPPSNWGIRAIRDDVGSEFLYSTMMRMSENQPRGLQRGVLARLRRELSFTERV